MLDPDAAEIVVTFALATLVQLKVIPVGGALVGVYKKVPALQIASGDNELLNVGNELTARVAEAPTLSQPVVLCLIITEYSRILIPQEAFSCFYLINSNFNLGCKRPKGSKYV